MMYEDSRGWRYTVMAGLGTQFKARYLKPKACGWHCVKVLPWRDTVEEAENDLVEYAKKKKMRECQTE